MYWTIQGDSIQHIKCIGKILFLSIDIDEGLWVNETINQSRPEKKKDTYTVAWVWIKHTDNPLYTDTRYNDKIRNNVNLTVTKFSLKR